MGNLGTVSNACGGFFYDSQGPGTNYQNNENYTATFCAPPGQYISFNFTAFQTEGLADWLDVYNGPNTGSPLIGSYTGGAGPSIITSSLGGCITFVFTSDGTVRRPGWEASITCSTVPPSTGNDCGTALPFCTGTSYVFPNNTDQADLGPIDCLGSTPNPVWYYMQIANPGNLNINIAQTDGFGFGIDVDFDLWGPFTTLENGCLALANGTAPSVDCSYSIATAEQANITGALAGEFYILLLTNYSNSPGTITFNSTGGSTATTNCGLLCNITDITANPSACVPATNTYSVSGQVTVSNPPTTGTMVVSSSCGGSVTINAPFVSPVNYTLSGIIATGSSCNITASFSADPGCSFTQSYTAPVSCASTILNCPVYASTTTSPNNACAGQVYYFDVANTACNGNISFNIVGNYGSSFASEISWQVTSNLTGGVVANGFGVTNGSAINVAVGPLNPAVVGTIFTITVFDAFGDGFNGTGGTIVVQQNGVNIVTPITGNFGIQASNMFGANIAISPATITITTPTGPVTATVTGCNNFHVPITLQNTNFCNTININLPFSIVCQSTGAIISSGTKNVTIYPSIPTAASDLVSIDFNSTTCTWSMTPQNDCIAANIGSIFTVSPNPTTLASNACTAGGETFNVDYIGISGGPNCCSTGGPLVPITYNQTFNQSNVIATTSPFWVNSNHAALLTVPAYNIGGTANSLTFNLNINGYCFNQPGPNALVNTSYWVTIVVNGQIVYDQQTVNPGPVNNTVSINLATLPSGYNQNSIIQVYIYPNSFAASGTNTVFNPATPCPIPNSQDGQWTAQISSSINASFNDQTPTPAICTFNPYLPYSCCSSASVPDGASTICSGAALTPVTAWQSSVAAANTSCLVYSSVLPVAGSVLPDNILPNGINLTTLPVTQTVSAYTYCDTDGSATINAGDTYTLVSTFILTVNPLPTATISGTVSICGGTGTTITFTGTPNATISYTVNGGATQTILLNASGTATLATGNLIVNTTYALTNAAISGPPACSQPVTGNAVVTISPPPVATFTYPTPVCKNGINPIPTFTGGGIAGVFSSSPGLNFVNTSTGEINLATSTPATYTVTNTIAASGGCPQVTATFVIVINTAPALTIASTPVSAISCFGVSPVTLTVSPNNFTNGYAWSPATGLSGVIGFSVVANPSVATTYTVVGTAANGCTSSASILVNVVNPSDAGINGNISLCSNGSPVNLFSSLGGTPQATGTWTGPSVLAGGNLGTFTPGTSIAGVYTYTVSGTSPCPNATATVTVTVNPNPDAGSNGSITLCANSAAVNLFASLGGSPQSTGTWSGPSVLSGGNLGTFTPGTSIAGVYTYTVAGVAPCVNATASVTVTENLAPNAGSNGSINLCSSGSAVNLFASLGGIPQSTGTWSGPSVLGGGNLGTFTPGTSVAGVYTYTVAGVAPCVNSSATVTVTVNVAPNAGSNGSISLCSNSSAVNLFASLGGSPQSTGAWSGPSVLGGGNLGTFTPGTSIAGVYVYTVLGTSPCSDVTASVTVSVDNFTSTNLSYPGSPFCTSFTGNVNPIITGVAGGTFSAAPAGLTINGTGVITPSTSSPGTYTVTYNVPISGACPAYNVIQTVVVTALPAVPTLIPNPPCAGSAVSFTASGGSMYEFLLNTTSQGPPSNTNTVTLGPLNVGDLVCVNSYPPIPFNFNGLITEAEWGSPLSTSNGGPANSGFGVGNNLDALYLKNGGGYLFGALAGNVVNGSNNRLLLFIDCQAGGYNNLASWVARNNAPYVSVENLNNLNFDAGFTPEYILAMNQASGDSYFDLYNMTTNLNNYLGTGSGSPWLGFSPNIGTGDFTKGFEFAIPMTALGNPAVSVKVFAMLVNDPGIGVIPTTLSNQFLTPCGPAEINYGNGIVNFAAAAPNPIQYLLSADCFSQTCVTVTNTVTPTFSFITSICSGATPPVLPLVSDNGVSGTWNPSSINNTTGASYIFTPSSGCATPVTINITVTPNPSISPLFHD